jgi:putative kinase
MNRQHGKTTGEVRWMTGRQLKLNVAGLTEEIRVSAGDLAGVYQPLMDSLIRLRRPGRRAVVFLAGPPGSGKSMFAAILQALVHQDLQTDLTVLPMDGFHFPNAYLKTHFATRDGEEIRLADIKGGPESFDLRQLEEFLRRLHDGREFRWPRYDRTIHDVVPEAIPIARDGLFLVEGNYLLLDEPGWRELAPLAHLRLFISAPEDLLLDRLVDRQIRGGRDPEHARAWATRSDLLNIRRVMAHQLPADLQIIQNDRELTLVFHQR